MQILNSLLVRYFKMFPVIKMKSILIFASGKNRNAFVPNSLNIDHWETALNDSDSWKYFIGITNPNWYNVDSTNAAWLNGMGGFGYGDGDDSTQVAAGTVSLYYEKY